MAAFGCEVACTAPIVAYRHPSLGVRIVGRFLWLQDGFLEKAAAYNPMLLPCGKCIGCAMARARDWAVRCTFEAQRWDFTCFVTWTYAEQHCPRFLRKADVSGAIKRLRARMDTRFKFFACGEYGEEKGRPHYHALLFGVSDAALVQAVWPFGFAQVKEATPERIAYCAGYVSKKFETLEQSESGEIIDYETGEILMPAREFRLMSRGGRYGTGIGGDARRHWASWRKDAVWQGAKVPVPRYFHEAWKGRASDEQKAALELERQTDVRSRALVTRESLAAARRRFEVFLEHKSSTRRQL